jgi:16S rRNA (adenine1518-N6/adenine1519-N6)-dimethyltransferase
MEKFTHKKSLGQNFLNSPEIIEKIVEKANLNNEEIVVEIGAGEGVLTEILIKKAKKVIAIELDDRLIPLLEKKFETTKNVEIVHADILKINMLDFLEKHNLNKENYKVVANIPYYITAPIIRLFLELPKQPREILLMVQKEVAERIIAQPGEMSILAIACQFYADVEYLFSVPKKFFTPIPKVDSAIIKFTIKNQKGDKDKNFFRLVKIGFSAKRKTLSNNLANGFHKNKGEIEEILKKVNLKTTVRAQELSIEDWKNLEKELV